MNKDKLLILVLDLDKYFMVEEIGNHQNAIKIYNSSFPHSFNKGNHKIVEIISFYKQFKA